MGELWEAKGRVCKQRLGHQEANNQPGDAKVGGELEWAQEGEGVPG